MREPSLLSSSASKDAVLTATLSKRLARLAKTGTLDERGARAADLGADLLNRMLSGSALVEERQLSVDRLTRVKRERPTSLPEGIREYALALHAIKRSRTAAGDPMELLLNYRDQLVALSKRQRVAKPGVARLCIFFRQLHALFFAELHRPRTSVHRDVFGRTD